ncbi:MAG: S8 family peptidase [Candidatus Moraniibacteriota bacterium]
MKIKNPLFEIPAENNRREQKSGGGNPPPYRGDDSEFEKHKRDRVREVDNLIGFAETKKVGQILSGNRLFYEIEFHDEALAKSAQPRKLLEQNHIDVYSQIGKQNFLASSTAENLKSFRDSVSKFDLINNKNGSAYLSAITKIGLINKRAKLSFVPQKGKKIKSYLILADGVSEEDGKQVAKNLKKKTGSEVEYFTSQAGSKILYGSFAANFIDEISEPDPRNPIVRVEKSIDFFTPQELPIEYEYNSVIIEKPLLDAKIGVIDTGISRHPLIKDLILDTCDFIKDSQDENHSHGTFVAGRAIFGNDIENQIRENNRLIPALKILDIKVMRKSRGANDREIINALLDTIKNPKYKDIKVFNLSLNNDSDTTILNNTKSFFTRELDAIAYKHKVCLIVTAGNQKTFLTDTYPDCLFCNNSVITSPADIINGLSVGSIADSSSSRALSLNNEPSPFTRTGLPDSKKPDLAHFGGNIDKYGNYAGVGVRSLSIDPKKIYENIGTSFAAPLVSSIAAQIYAYLLNTGRNSIDLVKALVVHSASYNLPNNSKIKENDCRRAVGFGIPDYSRALDCDKSSATFIHLGAIEAKKENDQEAKEYKHKIKFIIPDELVGKNKKVKIRGTLAYTPLISESGQIDYTLADIDINLHYKNSNGTDRSAGLPSEKIDNRTKWQNLKTFEKTFSHYKNGDWEIWLTLTTRGKADTIDYSQDYALVISIEDITPDTTKRIDLHQIIREKYPIYNIIDQKVKTKIKL